MQSAIDISWWQLSAFMLILCVPLAISYRFQLKLEQEILMAVARMAAQLILVGFYLQYLFDLSNLWLNLGWLLAMLLIGASAITDKTHLPRRYVLLPVFAGLTVALLPVLALLLLALLSPEPVYHAQYLIPLAGMLLGNSLSGNIVALQRLFNSFAERNTEYEGALALGANKFQASFPFVQSALKQSQAPILASMATTGLVTLPGMMTGQILGGTDPMIAIKYQLVIMVAIFVVLSMSVALCLIMMIIICINEQGRIRITPDN